MRLRRLWRLLFALVPLVVVFGSAELGLRAAGWPPKPARFDHNEPYWVLTPGLRAERTPHPEVGGSFTVSTDSRGLRAPIHEGLAAVGSVRVAALGCSTTFGWGVADDESYPARLESRAREAGLAVELINGGQPGHTSFQGRWLWDTVVAATRPDVVILGYLVQDARKSAYTDRSQALLMQDHRFLKDQVLWNSRVYLGLRALLGSVQVRAKERAEGVDDAHGVHRVPPDEYADNLRYLVEAARAVGAAPVLFGYPLERAGYTETHRAVLTALGAELDVPTYDPQAEMSTASDRQELYFPDDRGHANAAGNDWIAVRLLAFLMAEGLLTPQT